MHDAKPKAPYPPPSQHGPDQDRRQPQHNEADIGSVDENDSIRDDRVKVHDELEPRADSFIPAARATHRLTDGLEDFADLRDDLDQALNA
jgi:O-acetylhomoserine/O-acetylserine sulfhydrylase-like pyridoxal-dependent enzyme